MKRRGALIVALVAVTAIAGCGDKTPTSRFGKTLVASYMVPAEKLAEFAEFRPAPKNPKLTALENVAFADSVKWSAPAISVTSRDSPYRLAIRVDAAAPGAGPAMSTWLAGWTKLDQDGDAGMNRSTVVAGLGDADIPVDKLTGPRALSRTAASAPVSFKVDGRVIPAIELQALRNMTLNRVDVEVWSGIPSASWMELLFGWQTALIGLVMLALWFAWFRKRD
jgi:hypothetical protein